MSFGTADNHEPKYNFQEQDEVWIVLDSDPDKANSRIPQITAIKSEIQFYNRWSLVESNPCFEVWLYFHGRDEVEEFDGMESSGPWKTLLDEVFKGGFDLRKHPIFIEDAKLRSEAKFEQGENGSPKIGSTEVFRLAENILHLLGDQIRAERNKLT